MCPKLKTPEEYEDIGSRMSLSQILEITRPPFTSHKARFVFEFSTINIVSGFLKKDSEEYEDKIKALLHICPVVNAKCEGREDAIKQLNNILEK